MTLYASLERMVNMFPWNQFPFSKEMKSKMKQMDQAEVNDYVQSMLGKVFPNDIMSNFSRQDSSEDKKEHNANHHRPSKIQYSVFETHKFVFVRIKIKHEKWLKQLKIYHTSNQLIIEHIPEYDDKEIITLPALVNKKGAKADYQDEVLEVKLYKSMDRQLSEIHVTDV